MKYTLFEISLPWSNAEQVGNYNTIERREGTYMILCANGGDSNVS